jgi:hypothetical protein
VVWVRKLGHGLEPSENLVEVPPGRFDVKHIESVVHAIEDLLGMHIPEDIEQDHAVLEVV